MYLKQLNGSIVMRNFGMTDYFETKFYSVSDKFQMAYTYMFSISMRWLNFKMTLYCTVLTMLTFTYTMICNSFFEVFQNNFWLLSLSLLWMGKCTVSLSTFLEQLAMSSNHWLSLYRIHQFLDQNESELILTDGTSENPKKAFIELD